MDELYIDINLILYDFIIENGGESLIYWRLVGYKCYYVLSDVMNHAYPFKCTYFDYKYKCSLTNNYLIRCDGKMFVLISFVYM
mgnify:CR=1 FL=1